MVTNRVVEALRAADLTARCVVHGFARHGERAAVECVLEAAKPRVVVREADVVWGRGWEGQLNAMWWLGGRVLHFRLFEIWHEHAIALVGFDSTAAEAIAVAYGPDFMSSVGCVAKLVTLARAHDYSVQSLHLRD